MYNVSHLTSIEKLHGFSTYMQRDFSWLHANLYISNVFQKILAAVVFPRPIAPQQWSVYYELNQIQLEQIWDHSSVPVRARRMSIILLTE